MRASAMIRLVQACGFWRVTAMTTDTRAAAAGAGAGVPRTADVGLSIVVPLYNEAGGVAALHARICEVARRLRETRGLGCEVVYVDDGSRDNTLALAATLPASGLDVQVV